jgi:acyl-CoA oxidase
MLDYPVVQNRVIPTYAKCLVPNFAGVFIGNLWAKNYKMVFEPSNKEAKEMHALISIFKPVCSWYQQKAGIEAMHCCENFGFMHVNGICGRVQDAHVNTTWEGDNTVLLMQTTQFILKGVSRVAKGKPIFYKSLDYIPKWIQKVQEGVQLRKVNNRSEFESLDMLTDLLEYRAAKAALEGAMEVQLGMTSGNAFDAFNSSLPFANNKAALFYGELFIHNKCREAIGRCESVKNAGFIQKILIIYSLTLVKESSEFFLDFLNLDHIQLIEETLLKLFDEVKYNMLSSMNFLYQDDHVMKSAIGSADGNVYDRLLSKLNSDRRNMGKSEEWRYLLSVRREGSYGYRFRNGYRESEEEGGNWGR